jgi:hypothetical protein
MGEMLVGKGSPCGCRRGSPCGCPPVNFADACGLPHGLRQPTERAGGQQEVSWEAVRRPRSIDCLTQGSHQGI